MVPAAAVELEHSTWRTTVFCEVAKFSNTHKLVSESSMSSDREELAEHNGCSPQISSRNLLSETCGKNLVYLTLDVVWENVWHFCRKNDELSHDT